MKYAIFADIHANLEALNAVLQHANSNGCDKFVCLGDIVGYNASPAECLEVVRGLDCPTVKGNHDEESSGNHSLERMNAVAQKALLWTREQLSEEQKTWLRRLRMVRQVGQFTIVHSTLDQPNAWNYVTNKFDAMSNFTYQFTNLCFHGHTHIPRIFVQSPRVNLLEESEIVLEDDNKYFINVGSVGQPRDNDWRASYAVYDVESKKVSIQRVEYDIATTQAKIREAGLPELLATRLESGN